MCFDTNAHISGDWSQVGLPDVYKTVESRMSSISSVYVVLYAKHCISVLYKG